MNTPSQMPATLLASLSHQQLSSNPYKSVPRGPNFSRTSLAANVSSPASIPTSHKVLLQPVIKSKGFNGSSERFVPDKAADGPGPANYNWTKGGGFRPKQASPNASHLGRNSNSGKNNTSGAAREDLPHSHSGIIVPTGSGNISVQNGYLASAASLLPFGGTKNKRKLGLLTGNTGPGPGSYDLPGAFSTQTKIGRVPLKPLSGNIKTVRSQSQGVIRVQEEEVIGPGKYEVRLQSKNTNSGVAMLSKVERFEWAKRQAENQQFPVTTDQSQANMGLAGQHGWSPIPIKETLKKVRLEDFDRVKKLLEIEAGSKDKPQLWNENPIPGPGSYNMPDSLYWTMNKPTNKKGGTVSFLTKNHRDAAFQPRNPSAPYYDIKSDFDVKKYPGIGMSSMFRSSTKRDQAQRKMTDRFAPVDANFEWKLFPLDLPLPVATNYTEAIISTTNNSLHRGDTAHSSLMATAYDEELASTFKNIKSREAQKAYLQILGQRGGIKNVVLGQSDHWKDGEHTQHTNYPLNQSIAQFRD